MDAVAKTDEMVELTDFLVSVHIPQLASDVGKLYNVQFFINPKYVQIIFRHSLSVAPYAK